jgi:hypothetical protein
MEKVTLEIETRAAAAITDPTWETLELRRTISQTREAVARLDLAPSALETVNQALDAASQEAAAEKPNRYEVGEHLGEAARTLKGVGALASAGTAAGQALHRAAELLGPAGLATIAPAL